MIKILICDDETSYAEIIKLKTEKTMISLNFECEIEAVNSIEEAHKILNEKTIDIAFLDVMINDTNSIEWQKNNTFGDTQFIFMTAFPEEAYNLSEIDFCYFLIKSKLTDEQFSKALKRAINNLTKKDNDFHIFKYKGNNYTLDLSKITYVETFNNNIEVNLLNDEKILLYSSLKSFEKELPKNFFRCHKCYLVNMNHIHGYKPYQFVLSNGYTVPIPPKKYIATVEHYRSYILNL